MTLYEFLETVHLAYRPRSYLEIGINEGRSLSLSRTRTIGVDPDFGITWEVACDLQVVKATSDDFFARPEPLAHFPDGRIDLAFVDGLHLFEYTLRDFMNVERRAHWTSVVVVDDVLPRNVARARRNRGSLTGWPGDVFKLTEVLTRYRPDLLVLPLDTEPTGVLLVLGLDPQSGVLREHYDEIVAEYVYPDPQRVPEAVLRRETASDPTSIADSGVWARLREAREAGMDRQTGWEAVRRSVEATARPAAPRELTPANLRPFWAASASAGSPPLPRRALRAVRRRLRPLRRQARRLRRSA